MTAIEPRPRRTCAHRRSTSQPSALAGGFVVPEEGTVAMTLPDHITLTRHAISRLLDMRVEADEIEKTLLHPRRIDRHKTEPSGLVYKRGRLILVVDQRDDGTLAVLTAIWATKHAKRLDDLHAPIPGRNTYREAKRLGLAN